jgi:hypothetical protein
VVLTRKSGLGARGWLLPLVIAVLGAAVAVIAVVRVGELYDRNAGVIRPQQAVPYGLAARHLVTDTDDEARTAVRSFETTWRDRIGKLSDRAASVSWREKSGAWVVVIAALSDDAQGVASVVGDATGESGEAVTAWAEGSRLSIVVVVAPSPSGDENPRALLDARRASVRSSVRFARAASLTAAAIVPLIGVTLGIFAVSLGLVVLVVIVRLARLPFILASRGHRRRERVQAHQSADQSPAPELPDGVEVVALAPGRTHGVSLLRVVPIVLVALPALSRSLWPGSVLWAAVLSLAVVLRMDWARSSKIGVWLRRLLDVSVLVGVSHSVIGVPLASPMSHRLVRAALAGTVFVVAMLWAVQRRRYQLQFRVGYLGARWLLLFTAFLVMLCASAALFLASNGVGDARMQALDKAFAIPGLVLIPLVGRRVRAARALAVREDLRRHGVPEVLYLRSFLDDGLRVRSGRRIRSGVERFLPWPSELFEDVLLRGLESIGPVVAIGKPGTAQTELGASRDLVVGPDWLPAVKAEMTGARAIFVVLGRSEGLMTELRTLRDLDLLDRVCIVVPPVSAQEASDRLALGTAALGGDDAWGTITRDRLGKNREIVALGEVESRRVVLVAKRRNKAGAYIALTAAVTQLPSVARRQPRDL